jgi:broad specificity phosphatase PhoE
MYNNYSQYEIFYIRHGETDFNDVLNSSKNPENVRCDETYIDCCLNLKGLAQVECLSKKLRNFDIEFVFCSPLNRCLETAFISLKTHPKRDSIKIIVYPFINEVVNSIHDVSSSINRKRELYNEYSEIKFDWSYFDLYYRKEEADTFFINFIEVSDQIADVELLIKNIRDSQEKKGLYSQLLSFFIRNNKRPESLFHFYSRTHNFKKFLKKFLNNSNAFTDLSQEKEKMRKEKEFLKMEMKKNVFVFTHSGFIRMSTGEVTTPVTEIKKYPNNCYKPENCEMVSIDFKNI